MTPQSPLLVLLLLVLAVGGPSPSPAYALPDTQTRVYNQGSYSFAYAVDAPEHKNFQDREEARLGQETRGRFRVALPDNRLQTVTYRAGSNGYTASISYDPYPSFEALRQSVGPIGAAPEIGQSVLEGIRRGENWKHHKGVKEESRPELGSSLGGHGTVSNFVVPTPTRTRPAPTRTRATYTRTRPTSTRTRPTSTRTRLTPTRTQPTPTHTSVVSTHTRRRPRPSQRRPTATSRPTRPKTTPGRVTGGSSPPPATGTRHSRPRPPHTPTRTPTSASTQSTHSESSEDTADSEDSAILNRLIHAIQQKLSTEQVEELPKGPPATKKAYSIADRESVRKRLEAVVHRY